MIVGVIAQLQWYHFGKIHHFLYFLVFFAAVVATFLEFHPALILTLIALSAMPRSRPGTWIHNVCAALGLFGYILTYIFPLEGYR